MIPEAVLKKAREVAGARTARGWRYAHLLDGIEARAILDGNGYLFGRVDDLQNGEFIIAAERLFDALLDVASAALELSRRHEWNSDMGMCVCMQHVSFKAALARLAGVKLD